MIFLTQSKHLMPTHEKYGIVFLQTHLPKFAFEPSHKNKMFPKPNFEIAFRNDLIYYLFLKFSKTVLVKVVL